MTRDSATWIITAALAALGYLATMPPPTAWSYQQWIGAGLAALLWVSGKLASSPLKHSDETKDGAP